MIIFLNDDPGYLNWVRHHRQGFVLEGRRKPNVSHLVLHRCTCDQVRESIARKRVHWTMGRKLKACSLEWQELSNWSTEETGSSARCCETCQPDRDISTEADVHRCLTKLGADVLDFVLEAALIHIEHENSPYRLTIGDIAACFNKTVGQLFPVLRRLIDAGYLSVPLRFGNRFSMTAKQMVLPTMLAMRTLEAFQSQSDAAIQTELDKLTSVPKRLELI